MAKKKKKVQNKKPTKKIIKKNQVKKTVKKNKKTLKEKFIAKKQKAHKKGIIKKSPKRKTKTEFYKKYEAKKKKATEEKIIKQSTGGDITIHDAQHEMLTFFKYEDKKRKNKAEVKEWEEIKKALLAFNKIIRNKKADLVEDASNGINTKKNYDILQLKKPVEIKVSQSIRDILVLQFPRIFKKKEFYLKEISYENANNKINYYSGKAFNFRIDTGFRKHFVTSKEIKKLTVLSSKSFAEYLLNIFEKDFLESLTLKSNKNLSKQELKVRSRVYEKLRNVIAYNREIISGEANKLYEKKRGGQSSNWKKNINREEGKYPILFSLLEEMIELRVP